ncbi:6-phosphogluconolactonase [Bacteroidota bacterium]|nr:6-phosphogluconolactonase [Bacteroidota bacterium]
MNMKKSFKLKIINKKEFDAFSAEYLFHFLKKDSNYKKNISIALSGGSTPLPIFDILKKYKLDWDNFSFFMVDERDVSTSNHLSNYGNIKKVFFDSISSKNYIMRIENSSISDSANNYENLIYSKIPLAENGVPTFDLICLGIGDDGHTASLFPSTEALVENKKLVVANNVPQLRTDRITLTFRLILNAAKIIIFTKGVNKQKIIDEIEAGAGDQYPIAKIINSNVDTTLILGKD